MMGPWQWLRFKCHQPCHQPVPGKNHGNIEMLGMFENMSSRAGPLVGHIPYQCQRKTSLETP